MIFGSFTEEALARYEALVQQEYKEKQVKKATQGSEWADTGGVGPTDKSFLETGESQDPSNYSEWDSWSFTQCIRSNGTRYGIADGKKCRKGTETKVEPKVPTAKEKQRSAIQKRGAKAVTKSKAEKVLGELQKEGATAKKATERRAEKGKVSDREEQVRQLRAKAFVTMDRLRQRAKRLTAGPRKEQVEARIERLQKAVQRLDKEQGRLRDAKPKQKSEGFGRIPAIYETGRGLA